MGGYFAAVSKEDCVFDLFFGVDYHSHLGTRSIRIEGLGRGGKPRDETLEIRSLNNARAARGRKGKAADLGFKPATVVRVE